MPYESQAQIGYMHVNHPQIAAKWDKKYPVPPDLPERKTQAYKRAADKLEAKG